MSSGLLRSLKSPKDIEASPQLHHTPAGTRFPRRVGAGCFAQSRLRRGCRFAPHSFVSVFKFFFCFSLSFFLLFQSFSLSPVSVFQFFFCFSFSVFQTFQFFSFSSVSVFQSFSSFNHWPSPLTIFNTASQSKHLVLFTFAIKIYSK